MIQKSVFHNLENAVNFAARCIKMQMVVLGDACEYWVVSPADAIRLEKLGYEIIF